MKKIWEPHHWAKRRLRINVCIIFIYGSGAIRLTPEYFTCTKAVFRVREIVPNAARKEPGCSWT